GEWVGGPMYFIKNGLGEKFHFVGVLFASFAGLAAFGIGNMTQANTISNSVTSAFILFAPIMEGHEETISLGVGVLLSALVGLVLIGGIQRIGSITEKLVPGMALLYILGCLIVIISNIGSVGTVLLSIVQGAFNPTSAVGGVVGITLTEAIKRGVGRGVFSNEAGLGSASIAHAAAQTDSPVKQGLFGVFEVFADTIVICTLTALTILCSGTEITYGVGAGSDLTMAAFAVTFGGQLASVIIALGISLFAFTTILSWGFYGSRSIAFLFGDKWIKPYQTVFVLFIVVGATMELSLAWDIADTLNGLMAIPNLIGLLLLSGTVFKLTKGHFTKQKES
ncbi:MAG: amino acid carrier protein, partial [Eubacteriales bacterium]